MGMLDIKRPDLSRGTNVDQKLQLVLDAVEQMSKQFQHALNHLGEESLSVELKESLNKLKADQAKASNAVDKQLLTSVQKKINEEISKKANDEKVQSIINGTEAVGKLENAAVCLTDNGMRLKAGGNLTTDSGNFTIDADGSMNAKNAAFSGTLTKDGKNILTEDTIVVSDSEPTAPSAGMVWIKPSTSNSGWNECTTYYYKG